MSLMDQLTSENPPFRPLAYRQYGYTWPPRPENAVPNDMLAHYEGEGWVGQIKKNGTCSLIFTNGTDVIFKTRHNEDHKMWKPQADHYAFFRSLVTDGQWAVFEAELLHNKGNTVKNTFYIFDILVWKGQYLVGSTFAWRQELLQEIFQGKLSEAKDHWIIEEKFWLAKPIHTDFLNIWQALEHDEDEGIVLKNPNATLKLCNKPSNNAGWQVKCRRIHKNYGF